MTDALDLALHAAAAAPRVLVALDFDGTLAPFVDRPEDARATTDAVDALEGLARLHRVRLALVSGRSVGSLRNVASPPEGVTLIGSHGAERWAPGDGLTAAQLTDDQRARLEDAARRFDALARTVSGATVERKPFSVVFHTRTVAPSRVAAAQADAVEAAATANTDVTIGHQVVEATALDVSKGAAVRRLLAEIPDASVVFVGDDTTDETVFRDLAGHPGAVTVKVGEGETAALHRVSDPHAVASLLARLLRYLDRFDA